MFFSVALVRVTFFNTAPSSFASVRLVLDRSTFVIVTPERSAPERSDPCRFELVISLSARWQLRRSDNEILALFNVALARIAFCSDEPRIEVFDMSAPLMSAL